MCSVYSIPQHDRWPGLLLLPTSHLQDGSAVFGCAGNNKVKMWNLQTQQGQVVWGLFSTLRTWYTMFYPSDLQRWPHVTSQLWPLLMLPKLTCLWLVRSSWYSIYSSSSMKITHLYMHGFFDSFIASLDGKLSYWNCTQSTPSGLLGWKLERLRGTLSKIRFTILEKWGIQKPGFTEL